MRNLEFVGVLPKHAFHQKRLADMIIAGTPVPITAEKVIYFSSLLEGAFGTRHLGELLAAHYAGVVVIVSRSSVTLRPL